MLQSAKLGTITLHRPLPRPSPFFFSSPTPTARRRGIAYRHEGEHISLMEKRITIGPHVGLFHAFHSGIVSCCRPACHSWIWKIKSHHWQTFFIIIIINNLTCRTPHCLLVYWILGYGGPVLWNVVFYDMLYFIKCHVLWNVLCKRLMWNLVFCEMSLCFVSVVFCKVLCLVKWHAL